MAVETDFSNTIDRGASSTRRPKSGTVAAYGSTVTITVSQGPEQFPVPSFSGLSKSGAEAQAADYGLKVSWFIVPGTQGATGDRPEPGAPASPSPTATRSRCTWPDSLSAG